MTQKVCLITGVGPGTGAALVRKFAEDYQVAMLARSEDRLAALSEEIPNAHAFPCDVADTAALQSTIAKVQQDLGDPAVVVHNAVNGAFGSFLEIDPEVLQQNFQVNTMSLLHLARATAPAMIEAGEASGHILLLEHNVTGDAMIAALQVLAIVVRNEKQLSSIFSAFFFIT